VIDEEAVKKIVSVLEDLESKLQKPFDCFELVNVHSLASRVPA